MAAERLRILHTESSLGWGGQEIRVLTEARGMARRGHEVALAAPAESRILQAAAGYGLEAIAIPIARKSAGGFRAMLGLLRNRSFDLVNTHSSTDSWLAAASSCLIHRTLPIVRTRHISAPVPRNVLTRWLYREASRRIVTTGERLRLQVIEETGAEPGDVISVPTGIDLERFRPGEAAKARAQLGLAPDGALVGIVATLRSWKGHRYLLEAFAGLTRPGNRHLPEERVERGDDLHRTVGHHLYGLDGRHGGQHSDELHRALGRRLRAAAIAAASWGANADGGGGASDPGRKTTASQVTFPTATAPWGTINGFYMVNSSTAGAGSLYWACNFDDTTAITVNTNDIVKVTPTAEIRN